MLFLNAAICLLTLTSPLSLVSAAGEDREDLGVWTVSNFQRKCPADTNECRISFSLSVPEETDAINCTFTITGVVDQHLDFRRARCDDIYEYTISSGWNDSGFTVIVIDEEFLGIQSFFGFRDDELVDGKVAEAKSRSVQRSRPADDFQLPRHDDPKLDKDGGEEEGLSYADGWKLTNVFRNAYVGEDGWPAVTTNFDIEHPDYETEKCTSLAFGEKGEDPATLSFYDVSCIGTDWALSWGYDAEAEEDVAIMTLMNPDKNRRAYFGFRYVNGGMELGENGPEPTYPYNV